MSLRVRHTHHQVLSVPQHHAQPAPRGSSSGTATSLTSAHELSRRRGCSPGWSAARVHSPTVSGLLRRSTRRPQVVPAWSCAFIRHPELITCRLHDGIAGLVCWLRRMFPVAARHAARLSMIPVNGLHHLGGTGRGWSIGLTTLLVLALESLIRAEFSRSAWLTEAEPESHRHRE